MSVRVVELSNVATVLVDIGAWGLVHGLTGYAAHKVPAGRLARDRWAFRARRWERDGDLYRRTLRIHRWKDRLPEAGATFRGGISKRHVPAGGQGGLARFVIETRRAELGHLLGAAAGPLFALWNPPAVAVVMVLYGVLVNLPFVAIQRYNRIRASRVLAARASDRAARSRNDRGTTGSSMP